MANRPIENFRQVTQVAVDQPSQFLQAGAELGQKLILDGQEAKAQSVLSQAQLELSKLDMDYRIKYEGDPTGGIEEYRSARQELFAKYGEEINPFLRGAWNESVAKLSQAADGKQEAWAYEQAYKNKVTYTNNAMKNYLSQAAADGEAFGKDQSSQMEAFVNFGLAQAQLETFGNNSLGSETTKEMLFNFESDYIKTFVSGAVESNPERGLKLLDDERVKNSMPVDQWQKFRASTEYRAKAVMRNREEQSVLNTVRTENGLLSSGGKASYATIQNTEMSPAAREYFEGLNGFTGSGKRGGYTTEDKANFKMGIFSAVSSLTRDAEADASSVRVVQDAIYKAMSAGAIAQEEGLDLVQQIVEPLVAGKEKAMGEFGRYRPFADSIGFDGVEEFYNKVKDTPRESMTDTSKKAIEVQNTINKANLYDTYYGALRARAAKAGIPVADVPKLPRDQREKIYSEAQSITQETFLKNKFPALRTMPDVPNFVYSDGKLIQGAAGPRNVQPNATAKANFRLQKDTETGDIFRVYGDGTKEMVRKGGK